MGRKFYIETNQRSLKYLLEQRITTPEQQNWVTKLLVYDYEIKYKPGRKNNVTDALSWVTSSPSLNHLFVSQNPLWDTIKNEAIDNPYMQRIGKLAIDNPGNPYKWHNCLVCFKNRVVVPPQSNILPQILQEFHDSPIGGHSGVLRTYKRISQQFYWSSMYQAM